MPYFFSMRTYSLTAYLQFRHNIRHRNEGLMCLNFFFFFFFLGGGGGWGGGGTMVPGVAFSSMAKPPVT